MEELVVGTLLDAYDQFNRFKLLAYYTVSFGGFPSALRTTLPLERSKENVATVLQSVDLERLGFELIFKNWTTNDFQDTKEPGEYAFEYVYKSQSERMLLQITFLPSMLHIHFLYDVNSPATEKWILETNQRLRATHVSPKIPKFKVLVHQEGMFGTEDVNTGDFNSVDVSEMYNDDFAEIDGIITASIMTKQSGIILLHGESGTGKTTYIKHLICKFKDKEFIFVQNDFVRDLLKPSFVSFLLQNKNAILIIEDAEKVVASRNNSSEDSVVSTILQLTDGLFSDFLNIKIVCTFNTDIERIDKALLRKGRMIAKYNFKPLSPEKTAALVKKLGYEDVTGSLTLADIFGYEKRDFKDTTKKAIGFGASN